MATVDSNLSNLTEETGQSHDASQAFVTDSLAFGIVFAIALTVIQRAVGFGRGILFCRIMTDQELGQWSLVYSFLMLLAPFAVLGLPGCFGRYSEYYLGRKQLGIFVRRIAFISCVMTMFMAYTCLLYTSPSPLDQRGSRMRSSA